MFGIKKWRRRRLCSVAFPPEWLGIIESNVPYYKLLPEQDREELLRHILVFVAEKNFEGCGGLRMTDEIKVTIAAHACVLLLHRKTDYYPGLYSILVYPGAFVVKGYEELWPGIWAESSRVHLGESWKRGTVILSWDDIRDVTSNVHSGHNVILHEFAHQLDTEDGTANGAPVLRYRSMYAAWARILGSDFKKLREDAQLGHETLLDQYGATDPAEFFAVATECFFERPVEMRVRHPELYRELSLFYEQDPATLFLSGQEGLHKQSAKEVKINNAGSEKMRSGTE
jgi:Mlc titration factor MtfA (ptsG expression regulator)